MSKIAVVTGGERSLGASIVHKFSVENNWKTHSLSRPVWDLLDFPSIIYKKMTKFMNEGTLPDVFVHNAGMTNMSWAENASLDEFDKVMRVNLVNRFTINSVLIDYARINKDKQLRIIHIISMASKLPLRQSTAYCASKAADAMMVKQLAKELASRTPNVLIYGVNPGGIENTDMLEYSIQHLIKDRGMTEDEARDYNKQSPMKRNARHEEIVSVVNYLATDAPEYMSGSIVDVGGCVA